MPAVESYRPGTPCWLDLLVYDREPAMRFYAALFGWDFEVGSAATGRYTTCLLDEEPVAGITAPPDDVDLPTTWLTWFAVTDVDAAAATAAAEGGAVVLAPQDDPGRGRRAMVTDPAGALLGLWQAGAHVGAARVNEPGTLSWTESVVARSSEVASFYAAVLGLEADVVEGDVDYVMLRSEKLTVAGVFGAGEMPEGMAPHWLAYVAVEDADASTAKARDVGGQVVTEAHDSAYGRVAVVRDPLGGVLALVQMPEEVRA